MRLVNLFLAGAVTTMSCAGQQATANTGLAIGSGDQIAIQVLEAPDLTQHVRVTEDGDVPLILGGKIKVAGLAPGEAAHAVEKALIQNHYLLNPHVSISIEQYATQNVTVIGQVHAPGSYSIGTPRSVLDVLALAGGLNEAADRKITIEHRSTKNQVTFFYSNDSKATLDNNVSVYPGDTVLIPKSHVVYILGDVGKPGGYAMATNDSRLSVLQAIALAGATLPNAVPSKARLIRKNGNDLYEEQRLPLSAMQKGKSPDFYLQSDDIIYVPFSYLRNAAMGAANLAAAASTAAIYRF